MIKHEFIFESGTWIGEGRITFSASPEHLHYYTRWRIEKINDRESVCKQEVEMRGADENVHNKLSFSEVTPKSFKVTLENELIGKVTGTGVTDDKTIAWEYRGHSDFEGFEVYELQENGDYMIHAEYASSDQYRTIIDGRVWKKSTPEV
jgi:hypothetical protein